VGTGELSIYCKQIYNVLLLGMLIPPKPAILSVLLIINTQYAKEVIYQVLSRIV